MSNFKTTFMNGSVNCLFAHVLAHLNFGHITPHTECSSKTGLRIAFLRGASVQQVLQNETEMID
jgi:hypothetical protein